MSAEFSTFTPVSRTNLERTITKIGVRGTQLEIPGDSSFSDDYGKYEDLARVFYDNWADVLSSTCPKDLYPKSDEAKLKECGVSLEHLQRQYSSIRHGFNVTGRIVGMSVAAYKRWRELENRDIDELVAMQKNPKTVESIPLMLSRKPGEINKYFEEALCLVSGHYSGAMKYGYDAVRAHQKEDEQTGAFYPNLITVIQQFGYDVVTAEGKPEESCPAQRFIPILWTSMVDFCAEDPRFYATDLKVA